MDKPTEAQIILARHLLDAVTGGQTRKEIPQIWQAIHGRRFLLPQYRQQDYANQDKLNEDFEFSMLACAIGLLGFSDDVHHAMYANFCGGLWYDRPMLFLETELAEPLGESSLPEEMLVADIEWRWPQFRLMLPKGYLTIQREGKPRSVLFLDFCHLETAGIYLPPKYGAEADAFVYRLFKQAGIMVPGMRPSKLTVAMNEPYVAIVGGLDWSEIGAEQGTSYATIVPWNDKKIGELIALQSRGPGLQTGLRCDDADEILLDKMLRLAFNTLLFLSQKPVEFKTEVIRPARAEGKHRIKPALHKAHFLGKEQFKVAATLLHGAQKAAEAVGGVLRLRPHWRKGHWKRQPYGPRNTLRRWQWISIYHTFGTDEISK